MGSVLSFGDYLKFGKYGPEEGVQVANGSLGLTGAVAIGASALAFKAASSRTVIGATAVAVTATACFVNILRLARDAVATTQDMRRMGLGDCDEHSHSCYDDARRSRVGEHGEEEALEVSEGGEFRTAPASSFHRNEESRRETETSKKRELTPADRYFNERIIGQMVGTVATLLVVGAAALAFTRLALLGIDAAAAGGKPIPVPVVLHSAVAGVVKPLMTTAKV